MLHEATHVQAEEKKMEFHRKNFQNEKLFRMLFRFQCVDSGFENYLFFNRKSVYYKHHAHQITNRCCMTIGHLFKQFFFSYCVTFPFHPSNQLVQSIGPMKDRIPYNLLEKPIFEIILKKKKKLQHCNNKLKQLNFKMILNGQKPFYSEANIQLNEMENPFNFAQCLLIESNMFLK